MKTEAGAFGSLVHPRETEVEFAATAERSIMSNTLSFPQPKLKWGDGESTTIRFVYWNHTDDNICHVLPALMGSEVLAVEAPVGTDAKTAEDRGRQEGLQKTGEEISAVKNLLFGANLTQEEAAIIGGIYGGIPRLSRAQSRRIIRDIYDDSPHASIYLPFIKSGTRVASLEDNYFDAAELRLLIQAKTDQLKECSSAIFRGEAYHAIEDQALEYLKSCAKYMAFREEVAATQINDIAERHPGKRISVLYGRAHHILSRMVEAEGVGVQQYFAPSKENRAHDQIMCNRLCMEIAEDFLKASQRELPNDALEAVTVSLIADAVFNLSNTENGKEKRDNFYLRKLYQLPDLRGKIKFLWQDEIKGNEVLLLSRLELTRDIIEDAMLQ